MRVASLYLARRYELDLSVLRLLLCRRRRRRRCRRHRRLFVQGTRSQQLLRLRIYQSQGRLGGDTYPEVPRRRRELARPATRPAAGRATAHGALLDTQTLARARALLALLALLRRGYDRGL